jgi:pterin-4a-carbinolamine dehydratase
MKKLSHLHEEFIHQAQRPMSFDKLPVIPKVGDVPIVTSERWHVDPATKQLIKTYRFRLISQRNDFIKEILTYEDKIKHCGVIVINNDCICISLITKNINVVTAIDKEYAKFCDILYKDIVYNQDHVRQQIEDNNVDF